MINQVGTPPDDQHDFPDLLDVSIANEIKADAREKLMHTQTPSLNLNSSNKGPRRYITEEIEISSSLNKSSKNKANVPES